jgi:dTDP-4-amino-4,6-dideoxygalactose transaminase
MGKAYDVVRTFEEEVALWAGAKYGVAVESCCSAIFLCLEYLKPNVISLPRHTYPGVAMAVKHANIELKWWDDDLEEHWKEGQYCLIGSTIIDSALSFRKNMFEEGRYYCLSFHYKKLLPIGRGGMILTDNKDAVEWLKMARFDGRKEIPLKDDNATICGWNMYMTPEQASRGLSLFETIKDKDLPDLKVEEQGYPDLSKWRVFNER